MKTKHYIKAIFALLCLLTCLNLQGQIVASGDINEGTIQWELTEDSVFTISGSGNIPDYTTFPPWNSYISAVKKIIVGEGIIRVGNYSLRNMINLERIELANTVTSVGTYSFSHTTTDYKLSSIKFSENLQTIERYAFMSGIYLTEIRIPNSVKKIMDQAFRSPDESSHTPEHKGLEKVHVEWETPLADVAINAFFYKKEGGLTNTNRTLYVPSGKETDYRDASVWGTEFATILAEPDYYDVAFDAQGGSLIDTLYQVESGTTIDAPEPPGKANYVFDGWYTGQDYATAWDFETSTVISDTTLYAKWIEAYTVTFDSQDGSAVEPLTGVAAGSTIVAPGNPVKEGFAFGGWYTGPDYATAWNFETSTVVSDTTLYAKWTAVRTGTVQDYDGNWYNTVVYGNLEWMVENLRVTHFNDGTEIRKGEYTNAPGSAEDFAVYYMYPDNNVANAEDYGLLYTWNVAFDHEGNPPTNPTPNSHGFGPEGWRVPTRTEWATLGTTDWDGSVAAFLTVTGIPESFNPQFAGDFNTGGYANFDSRTEYWLPELVMPGQGYGCRWMHIDATAPTTVVQNQNRNNNCKSIRLVRDADNPQTAIVATDATKTALRIYPNAAGEYTVSGINSTATLTLYNLAGRVVFIQAVENGGSISLGKLAKGIYIAKASSETIKLIKK